jgi:tetratricopeptide (TPR) repeat protein
MITNKAKKTTSLFAVPFCFLLLCSCGHKSHIEQGKQLLQDKQYDQAIGQFDQAITEDPGQYYAYFGKGYAYANGGRPDLAVGFANKALELKPDDAGSFFVRGQAEADLNQKDAAIADMSQAITLDPKKAKYLAMRSLIYATTGKQDLAMAALVSQAIVYEAQGQHQQAVNQVQAAAAIEPSNPIVQHLQQMLSPAQQH